MPVLTLSNGKDIRCSEMVCDFRFGGSNQRRSAAQFVASCTLTSGESPGHAFISIPISEFGPGNYDHEGLSIALRSGGPADRIMQRTRMKISLMNGRKKTPLFAGWVVGMNHEFSDDSVIIECFDDRWALGKITCVGRVCWDDKRQTQFWDFGSDPGLRFNAFGYPDCVDSPFGPRFAQIPRQGYRTGAGSGFDDTEEPAYGEATSRARSWFVVDALQYLRDVHYNSGFVQLTPNPPKDIGKRSVIGELFWPEKLASVNGGNLIGNRKLNQLSIENETLLGALTKILRKAGAYDLGVVPGEGFTSTLTIFNMNPRSYEGTKLYLPDYISNSVNDAVRNASVIHSGSVSESVAGFYDEAVIIGDCPVVESMVSTNQSGLGAGWLEQAWSDDDLGRFRTAVNSDPSDNIIDSIQNVSRDYPAVFAGFKLKDGASFWSGTAEAGQSQEGAPRFMPQQASAFSTPGDNPRNWAHYEMIWEYRYIHDIENPSQESQDEFDGWYKSVRYDSLALTPARDMVLIDAARENLNTYFRKDSGTDGNDLFARPMRGQVAIQANFPLVAKCGESDMAVYRRVRVDDGTFFSYVTQAAPGEYVQLERLASSRPVGSAEADQDGYRNNSVIAAFPPKVGQGNQLFTDLTKTTGLNGAVTYSGRMWDHAAQRAPDVKRISYEGVVHIAGLRGNFHPGQAIEITNRNPLPCFGVIKSVTLDGSQQMTHIEFGPPDSAQVYSIPANAGSYGSSGTYKAGDGYRSEEQPTIKRPTEEITTGRQDGIRPDDTTGQQNTPGNQTRPKQTREETSGYSAGIPDENGNYGTGQAQQKTDTFDVEAKGGGSKYEPGSPAEDYYRRMEAAKNAPQAALAQPAASARESVGRSGPPPERGPQPAERKQSRRTPDSNPSGGFGLGEGGGSGAFTMPGGERQTSLDGAMKNTGGGMFDPSRSNETDRRNSAANRQSENNVLADSYARMSKPSEGRQAFGTKPDRTRTNKKYLQQAQRKDALPPEPPDRKLLPHEQPGAPDDE